MDYAIPVLGLVFAGLGWAYVRWLTREDRKKKAEAAGAPKHGQPATHP